MSLWESIKERANRVKKEVMAVWFAARDPRTPWYAKTIALLITAYALSPIDLIPDFIPVLGYLDDLLIIPAGIALALKFIPAEVMADSREKANETTKKPVSWLAGILIGAVWLVIIFLLGRWCYYLIFDQA